MRVVRVVRVELTRPEGHQILSLARLPIPPYPHTNLKVYFVSSYRFSGQEGYFNISFKNCPV